MKSIKMTRKLAFLTFAERIGRHLSVTDTVSIRCGFVDFIDFLQKDGRITDIQAQNWSGLNAREITTVQIMINTGF